MAVLLRKTRLTEAQKEFCNVRRHGPAVGVFYLAMAMCMCQRAQGASGAEVTHARRRAPTAGGWQSPTPIALRLGVFLPRRPIASHTKGG